MTELAQVTLRELDGITVAAISGEVDVSNAGQVATVLTELPNLAHGLVVDLHALEYLDSTGVSLLHDLAARLRQRSQRLIVVCPPSRRRAASWSSPRCTSEPPCSMTSAPRSPPSARRPRTFRRPDRPRDCEAFLTRCG